MKTPSLIALCLLAHTAVASAGSRASADYAIATDITDSGGGRATSGNYAHVTSFGGIDGTSAHISPAETIQLGYIGQLYEIIGLQLSASPTAVNEGTSRQVNPVQLLDDTTTLPLAASLVTWSLVSGPISLISSTGLATAARVFRTTNAAVRGALGNFTATLQLSVLDSDPDNFGAYAGDGLPDDWQVQYFGFNNPLAAPGADATRTGQNNQSKYLAGLNPVNRSAPNAVFTLKILPVPGQPTQKKLIFSPRYFDRTYTVNSKPFLPDTMWAPLVSYSVSDTGLERTVTDLDAIGATKFYKVEVTNPDENALFSFNPPTDTRHTEMLRAFRVGNDQAFGLTQAPAGTYDVYLWTFSDGSPQTVTVFVEGAAVSTYTSGPAGRWDRLGPFRVAVTDGDIQVRVQCADPDDVVFVSGLEVWRGGGASSPAPPARSSVFHRGVNLGGPAIAIDGNTWDANTTVTPNLITNGSSVSNPLPVIFNPVTPTASHETMLRTFRYASHLQLDLTSVPNGTYDVYVWTFEDSAPLNATLFVDGNVLVPGYTSGPVGRWDRLGPFPVMVSDGTIQIDYVCNTPGDSGLLSGVEVWRSWVPLTPPSGVFYRAINVGGTAMNIDGNNWEGEGASNYTTTGGSGPF